MKLNLGLSWSLTLLYRRSSFNIFYQSVVGEVEANLQQTASAGCDSDPHLQLVSFVEGNIFLIFCPDKSGQEVVSGIDLAH